MPWYKTGTVSVVLNSNAVTGVGTSFIANCRVGDAFRGPDGRWYEVTNAPSNTSLSIDPPYLGATVSGGSYALAPMQGYVKDSADALRALVNTYGAQLAALGTTGNYDILPVNKGGTGGTDQATARAGLGLGTTGNYDVLPVIKGGTGGTTQAAAQSGLGLVPQQNTGDVTAGRLLTPGAFGWGGTGVSIAEASLNSTRQTQLNIVSAAGLGILPANINSYVFHWNNPSNGYAYQTCRAVTGGPEYTRYQVAGTWSAWDFRAKAGANSDITSLTGLTTPLSVAFGGTGNNAGIAQRIAPGAMVGTVSQSSGVPTGAIIERGSNANGEYVKFADGTMLASFTDVVTMNIDIGYASIFYRAAAWTFPLQFAASPTVSLQANRTSGVFATGGGASSVSAATLYIIDFVSVSGASVTRKWFAMGRWF
ncbi:hypothetical protein [Pseudomonas sp. SMN5]|uniref:hypothetical protein n=1 Tax=Pseudomonas sp. SMN5 TaxID=3390198 RepID=UPI003F845DF1